MVSFKLQSHPGFAYEQLYAAAADNLLIYGTGSIITIVFSLLMVNIISQTLTSIQTHSQKLSNGEFQSIENVPNTFELKETVLSFNAMTNKLATAHQHVNEEILRFKTYALTDKQTNTGNRRAFEATLKKMLLREQIISDPPSDGQVSGTMYIIRLTSLQTVSDKLGFISQQQYTQDVVQKISAFFA